MSTVTDSNKNLVLIDARGPRYSAGITTTVLALALITESNYLIGFQFAVFLSAVLFGLRRSIYGLIYRNLIQPRLSGPVPCENEAAPRFAQLIGALFAFVALLGGVTGSRRVIKDNIGRVIEDIGYIREPQDGTDLALSSMSCTALADS